MVSLKKIQLLVVVLSLLFLPQVKQTGMTEMPSPSSNMSSTRNISTIEVVGSCVIFTYIHLKINCISWN